MAVLARTEQDKLDPRW